MADAQPKLDPSAFTVRPFGAWFAVIGPDGKEANAFPTEAEAKLAATMLRNQYRNRQAAARPKFVKAGVFPPGMVPPPPPKFGPGGFPLGMVPPPKFGPGGFPAAMAPPRPPGPTGPGGFPAGMTPAPPPRPVNLMGFPAGMSPFPPPPPPTPIGPGGFPAAMAPFYPPPPPAPAPPPPSPPPPRPAPNFFRRFGSAFAGTYAHRAQFGVGGIGGAARGALALAAPELSIGLGVGKEVIDRLKEGAKFLKEFGERTVEANRGLARYNGQLAMAYARLGLADFRRDLAVANRTAPGAEALVKAVDRMRDGFQEFRVLQGNVANQVGIFTSRVMENTANMFSPFVKKLNDLMGRDTGGDTVTALADMITAIPGAIVDAVRAAFGLPPAPKAAPQVQQGAWDDVVRGLIRGQFGGPILPQAQQQRQPGRHAQALPGPFRMALP